VLGDEMMHPEISIKNLIKSFGSKKVLQGINLDINKGEALVVLGGSGSGKSVLIKTIVGLISPDSGSILVGGKETVGLSYREYNKLMKNFGFLFQGGALFDSLSIWENISFALVQNNIMSKKDAKDHAIKKLADVGLEAHVADLLPAELSGGMQKRASLARAISLDPEIVFFDEPTTGLDPIMAGIINELIVKTTKELGATTITITHDMHSAKTIADRVAMLYEGKIVWHDSINKLDDSGNEIVDQFINGRSEGPIKIKLQDH
jgi:phospholipid/cholesterol/gamma-HCH transport system ATP-binding protein